VSDGVDDPSGRTHGRGGHPQVSKRVPRVGIRAVLRHDQVRAKGRGQLWDQGPDGLEPGLLAGPWFKRDVDGRPGRGALAQLPHAAGAGKQIAAGFVE
jgi:hypothetical protein